MSLAASILGTLPSWLLVAMALFVAWRLSQGGGASAVSELSKANEVLTNAVREEREKREQLGAEVRDLTAQNAKLGERTDFAKSLAEQAQVSEAHFLQALARHEERAIERHTAQLAVMEMMAKALTGLGYREENGT